ncbi:MAG: hypothetical protein ONB48_03195 [candidate division KSB1 bacterium]|nr:hypothetical protein [candidate division KSB1 bacterium]MDZ7275656.1 hypothetical protein [candidate division KSB1 bacterium]MDZ7284653.1 hypothetical protein [candidate division KSB1 bacterium]MDZ7297928.1 hypothetical protein [candidate division KSB1 bacterium]MDZ7307107.1 hypothetical protein [candidate division KSB1 bacterium]
MRMEDWIEGPVLRIIAGDTFEMQVTLAGAGNDYPYNPIEVIRLEQSAPPPDTEAGEEARRQLTDQLSGKIVRCYVKARAPEGHLYCEVIVRE